MNKFWEYERMYEDFGRRLMDFFLGSVADPRREEIEDLGAALALSKELAERSSIGIAKRGWLSDVEYYRKKLRELGVVSLPVLRK